MRLLTLTEVGDRLGLSSSRLRVLIKEKRLRATLVGKTYAVSEKELARFAAIPRKDGRPRKS